MFVRICGATALDWIPVLITAVMVTSCLRDSVGQRPPAKSNQLIYRDKNGRELTEADLADATGTVNWSIPGSENVTHKAHELHQNARKAGSSGDYKEALDLLAQASKEAPDWPYPIYDAAFTYLLMGDMNKALENYEVVNRMAPRGFFTVKTAVHSLRREKAKELEPGTYRQYVMLESVNSRVEKRVLVEKMVKQSPNFAPAWKELSWVLDDEASKLQAIEKGLSCDPDDETKGFLLINKSLLFHRQGRYEEAVSILGDMALDPKVPLDIEQIAKATLVSIKRSR